MAKNVLVFQHMAEESGNAIIDMLERDGCNLSVAHLYEGTVPDTTGHDLLLVLGGVQNAWETDRYPWLDAEKHAIRDWVADQKKPFIGICLGHQLLADVMGGTVARAAQGETGMHPLTLNTGQPHDFFKGVPERSNVMQWHSAEVARPPEAASVLASSPNAAVQAIAIGNHALGVQFHMEWTRDAIANWPRSWTAALDKEKGPGGHEAMVNQITPHMPAIEQMTRTIYDNFMRTTGLATRVTA